MKLQRVDDRHQFRELLSMETTSDVVFCVRDERFPANRIVVAESSPYFEKVLHNDNNIKVSPEEEVLLCKCSPRTWRVALDFIYGEQINLSTAPLINILELHECAVHYQLDNLNQAVVNGLMSSTSESNFCERLKIAEQIGNCTLKELVFEFAAKEFKRLRESNTKEVQMPQPMNLQRLDEQHPFCELRYMEYTFDGAFRIAMHAFSTPNYSCRSVAIL